MSLNLTQTCDRCGAVRVLKEASEVRQQGWRDLDLGITCPTGPPTLCPGCQQTLLRWIDDGPHGPVCPRPHLL